MEEIEQPKGLKNDIKQVIIVRKDLNMRKGKMIAQGSHASMAVIFNYMTPNYQTRDYGNAHHFCIDLPGGKDYRIGDDMSTWMTGMFKKIVVGADSLSELVNAYQAAKAAGLPCSIIEDKGLTEFGGVVTITAAAIGPANSKEIDKITGGFTLL